MGTRRPGAELVEALEAAGALRGFARRDGGVFVHPRAEVEAGALFRGPAVVSAGCSVAASAYLREGVILGPGARLGHAVEVKSSIVCGGSALAHLSYAGNSLVGGGVNVEAGAVLANHLNEAPGTLIRVRFEGRTIDTGALKFGALVGHGAKIGANAVLSPGTILAPGAIVPRLGLVAP